MLLRAFLALVFLCLSLGQGFTASRFWNPYSVTGAVSGTGGVCRLTISPAITGSGLLAGDTVSVTSIVGATECNTTTTISTVVDSTHIELAGTTFSLVYGSGGCVGGGNLTTTNTSNWAASSTATCGSGGQSVPGSADTATWDANSLAGTTTLNFGGTWTLSAVTMGAFTGTWDNSVNNNNVTVTGSSAFSGSGSGARVIKLGTATYSLTNSVIAIWDFVTTTNLTLTATNATIAFSGGTGEHRFSGGTGQSYGTVTYAATSGSGYSSISQNSTIGTLTVTAPNYLQLPTAATPTIGTALNLVGTAANQIGVNSGTVGSGATINLPASQTASWTSFRSITAGVNALTATNSFNLGGNTNITITAPQAVGSGGGSLIGG